jgi:hypothetical protein
MAILGLDVSTSIVGVCVVDASVEPDEQGSHIKLLDRIEFKHCKSMWEKADAVVTYIGGLKSYSIDRIAIEEPLMGFRPGMSSAQTITTLMRFNGIVSFVARAAFNRDPEYISSAHARKLCGVKLQRSSVAGPQKEQVFLHMQQHDLKHVAWPTKKSGKLCDWSRDACDAYCIARAASLEQRNAACVK